MKSARVTPISNNIFRVVMSLPIPFRMGEVSKPSILFMTSLYDSKYLVKRDTIVHTRSFLGTKSVMPIWNWITLDRFQLQVVG